jgi:hypothetical protein
MSTSPIKRALREGQKVIIESPGDEYHGGTGTIYAIEPRSADTWITVDLESGDQVMFVESEVRALADVQPKGEAKP